MKFKSSWMFHYLFLLIRFLLGLKYILGHVFIVYDWCASAIPTASISFCSLRGQLHLNLSYIMNKFELEVGMEIEMEVDFILSVQFHCLKSKQLIFMQRQRMKDLLLRVLKGAASLRYCSFKSILR